MKHGKEIRKDPLSIGQSNSNKGKRITEFRLGLVLIPVTLDEPNRGTIFGMCACEKMAIYAIEMTKIEVIGNLTALQPGSSKLFSKNDVITKYEVVLSPNPPSS